MSREKMNIVCLLFVAVFLCHAGAVRAAETNADDDEASMRSDGDVEECEGNVEINEGGLSIGSARNDGGEMKNVRRCTQMESVTIVNNGKTTVFRKKAKTPDGERGRKRRE